MRLYFYFNPTYAYKSTLSVFDSVVMTLSKQTQSGHSCCGLKYMAKGFTKPLAFYIKVLMQRAFHSQHTVNIGVKIQNAYGCPIFAILIPDNFRKLLNESEIIDDNFC